MVRDNKGIKKALVCKLSNCCLLLDILETDVLELMLVLGLMNIVDIPSSFLNVLATDFDVYALLFQMRTT